jgi:outer membrane lipoprotein-sorting protein
MKGLRKLSIPAVLPLFLILASCRSENETAPTGEAATETIVSSTPPFQTREPDRYRATRAITIVNASGATSVTKTLIARDGDSRRQTDETEGNKLVYLDVPQGRFVLLEDDNVYADLASDDLLSDVDEPEVSPDRLLHTDGNSATSYQRLGIEVVDGRNTNKYRVVVNESSAGSVSLSETLIWVDETLNMPIKSETVSADGTRVTMQLLEIVLEVDKSLFEIPENYEKVTFSELRKRRKSS